MVNASGELEGCFVWLVFNVMSTQISIILRWAVREGRGGEAEENENKQCTLSSCTITQTFICDTVSSESCKVGQLFCQLTKVVLIMHVLFFLAEISECRALIVIPAFC